MLLQVAVNTILTAAPLALVAVGFGIIFSVSRFFHFAHGVVFTAGAYCAFLLSTYAGFPVVVSIPVAVVTSAFLGCGIEIIVYRPLRRRNSSPLVLLLASLGVYILLQNVISLSFGDETRSMRRAVVAVGISWLGVRITDVQVAVIAASVAVVTAVLLLMEKAKMGTLMRGVGSNPMLAEVSGVSRDRVVLYSFGVGSALAGLAGTLVAMDVGMTPAMGLNALMMSVVATVVGGVRSVSGVTLGAVFLSLAQHLGAWKISSRWQDAIAFVILLAFLLVRPEGVLGKKVRKATV